MIERISQAESPDAISEFSKELGPAPIRAAYKWARGHSENRLGADIQWRRNQDVRRSLMVQQPQLDRLKSTIERVSEETVESLEVNGVLVAANTISRTFQISVPAFDVGIRGTYADAISDKQRVMIPKIYTACLTKKTRLESERAREGNLFSE